MATEIEGEAMGIIEAVKLIDFNTLSQQQKDELRRKLVERQQQLQAALAAVTEGINTIDAPAGPPPGQLRR